MTTREVAEKFNKTIPAVLRWARLNNVPQLETGKVLIYTWDEEYVLKYETYLKNKFPPRKDLPFTDNLDTAWHRAIRSRKSGNIDQYNQAIENIRELKRRKNEQ